MGDSKRLDINVIVAVDMGYVLFICFENCYY